MPLYVYQCDDCEIALEEYQGYHDEPLKLCPKCEHETLYRVLFAPYVSVVNEPKTVAQLADRNTKKMGHYELESKIHEDKELRKSPKEEKRPWYRPDRDLDKSLSKLTPEQTVKYITEGKK